MSHLSTGLISAYNSLTDKHLAGYFSNTRIRRHLQRAGLITRSGRIVPDKEYRHKLIQRAHQRHVRECLAQAIFHKVLEMERVHQIEIKRKLEEFARRERVHKIKVERSKRYEEDLIRILSPRPPTGARGIRKQNSGPEGEHSESSESPGSSRPNTAPGKMQRPVRLKPIHSNSTTASLRRSSPYRHHESSTENNQFNCTVYRESRRHFNPMEASNGLSPYCLPVINNFVTPVPPPTKRRERALKVNPSGTLRGRRLRPTTASSGADITEDPPMLRSSVHQSRVCVNMIYCGKTVHLSHDLSDMRDEVKVFQQHCGGENLCVYKGKLQEGETFQFISRRHRGFPFSLTFFLNGLQVERLSSCCEFKHRKGSRLGGRHGHFGFCSVEGASPCYKCIIAMGLDKKPTPPPKRVKEDRGNKESVVSPKMRPEKTERTEKSGSHSEYETSQPQPQDTETQVQGTTAAEVRDDYEEDFEADDEGPAEDTEVKGKKSPSPSVDMERTARGREASESEDDNEKDDIKSNSGSSSSGSEPEESDVEATTREENQAEQPKEVDEEESAAPPEEKDEPQPEESKAESAAPKDSDVPNSAGESTEIDISDTSAPSGNENKQSDDTSGEKEVEKTEPENKQEEEQERAKSVQEKLAEAILKESQRSSEPELSDTSTEDTVESTGRGQDQDHKDAAEVKSATTVEKQKSVEEERTCEEGAVAVAIAVAVMDQQNTLLEPKGAGDTEPKPPEISETTQDEEVGVDEDKKVETEEEKTQEETDKFAEIETTCEALLAVATAATIANVGTPETQEDVADKLTDASEKKEEKEEKEEKAEETEQGAKSSKEDESSASESNKETDETAVTDNAEAEAMTASGTMEMKAEPSEEREALSCEEAPVAGTETSQLGEDEDGAKTEVTEENRDTAEDKTADTSEDKANEESVQDTKEEALVLEASEDRGDLTEKPGEEEKQTSADESTEKEGSKEQEGETGEEKNHESKTEEKTEDTLNEEETHSDEKQVEKEEEETGRSGKTENDGDEDVKNKNNEEEVMEEVAAAVVLAAAAGTMGATIAAADEPKKEAMEEKSETTKIEHREESHETEVVTYKTVEKEKEPQNRKDADGVKTDENMESEDAADAALSTVMTAGMINTTETEKDGGGDNREKREVDAENGEESKPQVEEGGEEENTMMENERKTEGEISAESGNCDENVKSASASDGAEAKEEDDNVEKQDRSGENDSEREKYDTYLKEESESDRKRDSEETKPDENANLSEPDCENMDAKESSNIQENISEVLAVSSVAQAQSTTPTAADSDSTPLRLERSTALSENHANNKDPNTDENTNENTAATELSAADGDNGDTEEASKASEEGASVLLKPQAQPEQPEQQNEADKEKEEKTVVVEETAEVLAREDLVTNWVTMHQTSKFFETFVEPLEDLKEETSDGSSKEEATQPTELQRSVSPLEKSESVEKEHTTNDMNESEEKKKEESEELDVESKDQKDEGKDAVQEQEETEVQDFVLKTESEQAEDLKERSLEEDKGEEATKQEDTDEVSNTVVESIACATPKPESIPENQTEEKTAQEGEVNEKQATDLSPSKTEEQPQCLASPDFKEQDDTLEKSQDVTEISELSESRSDDGSQKEPRQEDNKPKASDTNINGERKDLQLIQDFKHTLSKERLSTFSVDETLFAPGSYPLLAAAQTESGH